MHCECHRPWPTELWTLLKGSVYFIVIYCYHVKKFLYSCLNALHASLGLFVDCFIGSCVC